MTGAGESNVVMALAIDDVASAHQAALELALDSCELGKSVAHLAADLSSPIITFAADGSHDLGNAISSIPTTSGRLIRVAIAGLDRIQVATVIANLRPMVDQVVLSGPDVALTQLSLEFATLADQAITVGGSASDAARLASILNQLGVVHGPASPFRDPVERPGEGPGDPPTPPADPTRRITPPGRV